MTRGLRTATSIPQRSVRCRRRHSVLRRAACQAPYPPLTEALHNAVTRGVQVTVVIETPQGAGSALSGTEPCHAFTGIEGVALWPLARRQIPDPMVNKRSVIQ